MAILDNIPTFQAKDAEIIKKTRVYDGFFKIDQFKLRHKLFNGQWSGTVTRELFERGHAGALLPYDPIADVVVMVEQFRIGAVGTDSSPWLLELVAGVVEKGESYEEVVRREAVEEADLTILRTKPICSYLSSAGGTSERLQLFVGEVDSSNAGGVFGLAEEDEDIRVHLFSRQQALDLLEQGVIDNAASVIALQWLALHGDRLRQEWLAAANKTA